MSTVTAAQIVTEATCPVPPGVFRACDGKDCGHRSYYFADINGTIMSYCGHHGTKYEVNLLAASHGKVWDLRYLINP